MEDLNCRLLFVYGTLRKDYPHLMSQFLAKRAHFIGQAQVAGRLFDLGNFPGLLEATGPDQWVQGDLYELLDDPSATLAALDRYESLGNNPPWFNRSLAEATQEGTKRQVWIYYYQGPMTEARFIPSGDFLAD